MRVAIRVDAGPRIGGGHAMRCLTLAGELAREGAEVVFAAAAMTETFAARIAVAGHGLARLPDAPRLARGLADWHERPLDPEAQQQDAEASGKACGTVDWMVVDHYLLDRDWHSAARRFAQRVLVIDDLANRQYDCDLLVDQTLGRAPADYKGLVPDSATVLAGAQYALLRPEFRRERAAALERRRALRPVERILVSLGTTDPGAIAGAVVDAVLGAAPSCAIDVALADGSASLTHVEQVASRQPGITVHVNSDHMAELMRDADLAIGAAGTSSWERCSLGLPAIALILAENQRPSADALERAGAIVKTESIGELGARIAEIVGDPPRLQRMSAAAFAITDARGASRVLRAMAGGKAPGRHCAAIGLREARADDSELLWLWRNDPVTRANSRTVQSISWTDHVRWLTAILGDSHHQLLIAERDGAPAGMVRADAIDGEPAALEISINVRPDVRGEGLGRAMLQLACDRFAARHAGCAMRASVRADNEASRRLFESCGFRAEGAEDGWLRYVLAGQHRSAGAQRKLA